MAIARVTGGILLAFAICAARAPERVGGPDVGGATPERPSEHGAVMPGPKSQVAGAARASTRSDAFDPLSWPVCPDVRVSIVTESANPSWSLTSLRVPGDARTQLRRVGDRVAGKQIAFIGYNPRQMTPAVWLEGGGASCQSGLFRPPQLPPAAMPQARGDGAITRSTPLSHVRAVRVVPERKNGKIIGLRLFGVRSDTVLGMLGLKNGDRLESINGFDLATPEGALEAYARLRTAEHLSLQLNRSGRPMNIDLRIL